MEQDLKLKRYFFLSIILLIGIFLIYSLSAFLTAFLAAIMFYVLSKQPVEWLVSKKRWRKSTAAILVIIISFFIILLPITLMVGMLYNKAVIFSQNTESIIEPLKQLDIRIQNEFHISLLNEKNIGQVNSFLTSMLSSLLNEGVNLLSSIVMMYFFLYFMIININRMEAAIILYLPFKRKKIELFGHELKAQTFSNAVGIPLIAVAQGLCAYVSFLITGLPEAGFWAVLTGFSSIIPVVGTGLVWLPVALYQLATGATWQGVFSFAWGLLVLGITDNVIRFLLAKKMADVHPLVTVLGVIIGLDYFGITGLIFGPLIISYFIILIKIYYTEYSIDPINHRKKRTTSTGLKLPFIN